jgi:hypothetical protein
VIGTPTNALSFEHLVLLRRALGPFPCTSATGRTLGTSASAPGVIAMKDKGSFVCCYVLTQNIIHGDGSASKQCRVDICDTVWWRGVAIHLGMASYKEATAKVRLLELCLDYALVIGCMSDSSVSDSSVSDSSVSDSSVSDSSVSDTCVSDTSVSDTSVSDTSVSDSSWSDSSVSDSSVSDTSVSDSS